MALPALHWPAPKHTALTHAGRYLSKGIAQILRPDSANQFAIASHSVFVADLPEAFESLRIIQLSDIHFYEYSCTDYHQRMVDAVNALQPDIIVTTGDIIHYGPHYLEMSLHFLKQLNARLGKWACMGNHDYIDDYKSHAVRRIQIEAGFDILVNRALALEIDGKRIWLSGIDDVKMSTPDLEKAYADIEANAPHISLVHNPKMAPAMAQHAKAPDLILAGHTHGGQIDNLVARFIHKHMFTQRYLYGWFNLGRSDLYVTSGIGSASVAINMDSLKFALYPFRINTVPEIVVMDLTGQPDTLSTFSLHTHHSTILKSL